MLRSLLALLAPRIGTQQLASLCHRLSTMLHAGVDIRKVMAREAEKSMTFFLRGHLQKISAAVDRGDSIGSALEAAGDFFPPLFCRLVAVGEHTGKLAEVLEQLAEHYDQKIRLRRTFISSISWPMIQLGLAVVIIGLLIWILGEIGKSTGMTIDPIGGGMVGERGLAIYSTVVSTVVGAFAVFIFAANRGVFWVGPIQKAACYTPVIGPALRTLALSRISWTLHITLDTGMQIRKALRVAAGDALSEAFERCGAFPNDFLEVLRVGEESGQIVEVMGKIAKDYNERAAAALKMLTTLAGLIVWSGVAAIIIMMIFRIASFYIGALNDATHGTFPGDPHR
jgi:type II secretory pathway component PulF